MPSLADTLPGRPVCWIISEAALSRLDPTEFDPEADRGPVKEYRISEIGRYLLNPAPIEIRKRLIGCELHPGGRGLAGLFRRLRSPRMGGRRQSRPRDAEVLLTGFKLKIPPLNEVDLEIHLKRIIDELRAYDPFARKLAQVDPTRYAHIVGICEDVGSGYSYLKLQGTNPEKLRYLSGQVGRDVRVTIHRANIGDGLFELRGFPQGTFNPNNAFRLVSYTRDGQPTACVLSTLGNLDFRVAEVRAVRYLSLLEQTLRANTDLRRALSGCFLGRTQPVRLVFNTQLEVDYSRANFPAIYRDIFQMAQVAASNRNLVRPALNVLQTAVSLSFLPSGANGKEKLFTQISILHDLRALEPLRQSLPAVYAELSKLAFQSEAGRFYLLDSITGATHAE
jgi:hypothetical protein